MVNLLFVCSGNVFRSLSAERLLRAYFSEHNEERFTIRSAGTTAKKQPVHQVTQEALASYGVHVDDHEQTKLSSELIEWADTIIAMADYHQEFISEHFDSYAQLYNEFARKQATSVDDIEDALTANKRTQEAIAKHIKTTVDYIYKTIPDLAKTLQERHFLFEEFVNGKRTKHLNGVEFKPVLENQRAMAFLSLDLPTTPEIHALVIPKERHQHYHDIPVATRSDMSELVAQIGGALQETYEGYNFLLNNTPAAGQMIFHAHIHLISRVHTDGIETETWKHHHANKDEYAQRHNQITNLLTRRASSNAVLKASNHKTSNMTRVAINGFGRIGRMVFRAGMHNDNIEFVAINDLTDTKTLAYLLKYDSVHGTLDENISHDEHHIIINDQKIRVYAQRNPEELPWHQHDVDVVVESTGFFRTKEAASKHITAGAKKVIISAPGRGGNIKTVVKGINEHTIESEHCVISNASCTTNCLGLLVKVLHDNFEIETGYFNTIHSYTGDQNHVDGPHKDLRRGRACAVNMVPTSSGAAVAVTQTIPELEGKITGMAVRVPTPDGSLTDFTCRVKKNTSVAEVNHLFMSVATHHMQGVLRYSNEELVSSDIVGDPHSAIVDGLQTEVLDGNHVRVIAWYDNEWGYSNRIIDLLQEL